MSAKIKLLVFRIINQGRIQNFKLVGRT